VQPAASIAEPQIIPRSRIPSDRYAWRAQRGPQQALLASDVEDIFYGGARGGGKTDGLLGDFSEHAGRYGPHANGALFRRTFRELEKVIKRAIEIYTLLGWKYHETKKLWTAPSGATLELHYLDNDQDASQYLGDAWTWLGFDELPNWPFAEPIDKLTACLRSVHGVPCVKRSTGNPGGAGQNWVKARYIDPHPGGFTPYFTVLDAEGNGVWRLYIPARLEDNPKLMENDPNYWLRIVAAVGDNKPLLEAWRWGRWDIVAGGFFDDIWTMQVRLLDGSSISASDIIVIPPFAIPRSWAKSRSFDWGSTRPFSVGWWAESDGTSVMIDAVERNFPPNTLFRIAEWYGWNGRPNEGLRMTASDVARQMAQFERQQGWQVKAGPADSQIFEAQNGVCIADDMRRGGINWVAADKGPGSRINGWARMRQYMLASLKFPMEDPGLFIFDTCNHFIRTIPTLPRDPRKVDDVDTKAEDHVADEVRYRVMGPRTRSSVGRTSGY
jgi:hypothetical protein